MNSQANRTSRLIALVMAMILLLSVFSGCKLPDNTVTQPVTIESRVVIPKVIRKEELN